MSLTSVEVEDVLYLKYQNVAQGKQSSYSELLDLESNLIPIEVNSSIPIGQVFSPIANKKILLKSTSP